VVTEQGKVLREITGLVSILIIPLVGLLGGSPLPDVFGLDPIFWFAAISILVLGAHKAGLLGQ
jgi:hypothetical protein